MTDYKNNNYPLVAKTIAHLQQSNKTSLIDSEFCANLGVSPSQLEAIFKVWAGVELYEFRQFITAGRTRQLLSNSAPTLFDTLNEQENLKRGKQHTSFVEIEAMVFDEKKNVEEIVAINYSYQHTLFGDVLIASTNKGVCYLGFFDEKEDAFSELYKRFPTSNFLLQEDSIQKNALECFTKDVTPSSPIVLHLKGTEFQLSIWRQLLKIPLGSVTTYGAISEKIQKAKASRAVGTAIGNNPVAFLIPCHRVVQSTGGLGGYRWGETRKTALIGWEAAQLV